jgi:radical SAM superfamily enzyme YgiQ (UPF0313 family)
MKTISLIQPNFQMNKFGTRFFIPYSAGTIWAYLKSNTSDVELNRLVFMREPLEELAQTICNDTLVGFSSYIWNREYNLALAKRLKELNPNIIIVFGGPEMEILDFEFFSKFPMIDIHVLNEGELTFNAILNNIDNWDEVPNIIYNSKGKTIATKAASRIMNLEQIPSPYLTGVFDDILKKYPEYTFAAVLETNRGCPYQCTFCDWGSLTYSKIRKFPLERVFAELEWIFNTRKIDEIALADANFGIFVDRDEQIVDKFIEEYQKSNHNIEWKASYAKNQNIAVVKMMKKLADKTDAAKNLGVSLQTLTENVLSDIKRKNLHTNKIKEIYEIAKSSDMNIVVELILGLPSETLESFKQSYYDLFDISPEITIQQHTLAGLNNAELTLTGQGGVKWSVQDYVINEDYEGVREKIKIVHSTDTMTNDDIIKANIFANMMIAFHFGGVSNIVSIYANKQGISYAQFYNGFYKFLETDNYISKYNKEVKSWYKLWYKTGKCHHNPVQEVLFGSNNDKYHLLIKMHFEDLIDYLLNLVQQYIKFLGIYNKDIMNIQKLIPIRFKKQNDYPINLKYNNKNINIYKLNSSETNLFYFLKNLYFERDDSFGVAKVKGLEEYL